MGLLEKGVCWRVGLGDQIAVWTDAWIPGVVDHKVQTLANVQSIQLVSDLIDQLTNCWKEDVNFAVAFNQQRKESCSGLVIRNEEGQIIKAKVCQNKYVSNVFAAEALACVQAIQFGTESGFLRVKIEGDALSIIKKLQNEFEDRSKISAYILNTKRLTRNFVTCSFKHVLRTRNVVAHTLATEGLNEGASTYLCNGFSTAVLKVVEEDYRVRTGIGLNIEARVIFREMELNGDMGREIIKDARALVFWNPRFVEEHWK
ncbi:hypothetical protein Gogos_019020 [Gossypium gossypioides]|uniref:RNase H type-1 domain-containing protein n=1 Tax=Gossypium gossypioides TaxID=34282 RepID=A0A7J9BG56_GOSGO|nr:hypothetical protein [Gossypium gossypioides]